MGTLAKYDANFNQKWFFTFSESILGIDWWGDGERYIMAIDFSATGEIGQSVVHAEIDWKNSTYNILRVLDTIADAALQNYRGVAFSQIGFGEQQIRSYDYIMFVLINLTVPTTATVIRENHIGRRLKNLSLFTDSPFLPYGIDINDRNGDFYLSELSGDANQIAMYDVNGKLKRSLGSPASAPADICFDGQNIWVADSSSGQIVKIDQQGNILRQSGALGFNPNGVCTDGQDLVVCN